jgi:cyclic pyranopterin phosphate synthase
VRVSVTDRCNFRCGYCMPRDLFGAAHAFLPRSEILTFEEITRLVQVFQGLGARKVRLTGGEPLLRADIDRLVAMLAALPDLDVGLTTNGSLLAAHAGSLATAGLHRVTVSLDALDDATFERMNDVGVPLARTLAGIEAAAAAGLAVKLNTVVRRGWNEHVVVDLVARFRGTGHVVRFIEYMDVGTTNGWNLTEVVPGAELVARVHAAFPLEPVEPAHRGEVARRYRLRDGSGEVGFITSVTQPFCGDCTRARISAKGELYKCLFATSGLDLRAPLRAGASDDELAATIRAAWAVREDRYSELRSTETAALPRVEMSYIGG